MSRYIPVEPEKWAEMVKAMAEVTRLKAEVERLTAEVSYDKRVQLHVDKLAAEFTQCEVEKLKAEVERLKQEKNELAVMIHPIALKAWMNLNAAKEGKQP